MARVSFSKTSEMKTSLGDGGEPLLTRGRQPRSSEGKKYQPLHFRGLRRGGCAHEVVLSGDIVNILPPCRVHLAPSRVLTGRNDN